MHDDLEQRKSQHLDLVQRGEVEPESADPLFDCVRLVHRALPELSLDEIDLSMDLCGRSLKAPLIITGMTGGTEREGQILDRQRYVTPPWRCVGPQTGYAACTKPHHKIVASF